MILNLNLIFTTKAEKIILTGFSQGGALALYAGLTCPVTLGDSNEAELSRQVSFGSGGVICLSSYLLAAWEFTPCHLAYTGTKINSDTPILLCHGAEDEKVHITITANLISLTSSFLAPTGALGVKILFVCLCVRA